MPGRSCGCAGAACRAIRPGDEYLQLSIALPPADSPKARAFYEQMSRELPFDPRAQLRELSHDDATDH